MLYKSERLVLFIDGANLSAACNALDLKIDFQRLSDFFANRGQLLRQYYYTAVIDREPGEQDNLRPLLDWLSYNGYHLVSKMAKRYTDQYGVTTTKGNMDIEIAVDAMEIAASGKMDHAVFLTGDGDFRRLFESLQRQGLRVTVLSTIESKPSSIIADELRRQADQFIDMQTIREHIEKRQSVKD